MDLIDKKDIILLQRSQHSRQIARFIQHRPRSHLEGRVEGLAEGRAEGEHVRSVEIARKMKIKGMSVSDISDMTGLDVEEIEQIDRF